MRQRAHLVEALRGGRAFQIVDVVRAHRAREIQPRGRRADRDDRRGAAEPRQRDRAQADGAGALHEHAVARAERRALEDVHGGQQPAAAADVVIER